MGRAGRPTVAIELTDEERETLVRWSRRHSSSQALALRSRIVLACADGRPNTKIKLGRDLPVGLQRSILRQAGLLGDQR